MAKSTRVNVVDRIRQASRELHLSIEKARATIDEYESLGGASYTDPFFHENEDINAPVRTDTEITKEQLTAAEVALNAISNPGTLSGTNGSSVDDYLPMLSVVK